MSLQQRILDDLKQSLIDKDVAKRNLLGVVIAEATRYNKEASDAEVIKAVKKYIDGAKLCHTENEIPLLEVYLPKEISDETMKAIIFQAMDHAKIYRNEMGKLMPLLKEALGPDFDGKRVSAILKTL